MWVLSSNSQEYHPLRKRLHTHKKHVEKNYGKTTCKITYIYANIILFKNDFRIFYFSSSTSISSGAFSPFVWLDCCASHTQSKTNSTKCLWGENECKLCTHWVDFTSKNKQYIQTMRKTRARAKERGRERIARENRQTHMKINKDPLRLKVLTTTARICTSASVV